MGSGLSHAPGVAGRTYRAPFAREGDQKIVSALATASTGEAVGQDAAFEVATKLPLHVLCHTAAIIVLLAGKLQIGLQMRPHRVVQRRTLGATPAVDGARTRRVDAGVHGVGPGVDAGCPSGPTRLLDIFKGYPLSSTTPISCVHAFRAAMRW